MAEAYADMQFHVAENRIIQKVFVKILRIGGSSLIKNLV